MNWETWGPAIAIISVNIALFGGITTLVIWAINKIDADVKSIGNRVDAFGSRLDGHAQRIDQLYHMFVDLVKDGRK